MELCGVMWRKSPHNEEYQATLRMKKSLKQPFLLFINERTLINPSPQTWNNVDVCGTNVE